MARKKTFQPYWRPNFRNASTLPDIKVIRTDFLVNGFAVACALGAIFFLLQKEYRARSLNALVSDLRDQVTVATPQNKKSLQLNDRFRLAGRYVAEIQGFYNTPFLPDELLVKLSNSVPEGLIYKEVSMEETVSKLGKTSYLGISLRINGTVRDLTILDEYKVWLRKADFLNPEGYNATVDERVEAPDGVTRIFPYQLTINVRPVPAKKGGKK